MTASQPPTIVIGGDSANGLGVAHALGAHGIDVYCVTSNPYEITIYSKYCKGAAVIPDIERNPLKLWRFLDAFAQRLSSVGVLFPTTDFAMPTVAAIRDQLPQYVTFLPEKAVIDIMVQKTLFYQSLRDHAIPHPRVIAPDAMEPQEIVEQLAFPLFIRPSSSRDFAIAFGCKGFVAHSLQDLQEFLARVQSAGLEVMIQELIPGPVTSGFSFRGYLNSDSQLLVTITTQKIRQASMFANPSIVAGITVPPGSALAAFQQRILTYFQNVGYHGLFGAEVKWDPRDHQFKLLEVNPRSMGGCYISTISGREDLHAAYLDALGRPVPPMGALTPGIHNIHLFRDVTTIVRGVLRGQPVRQVLTPYLHRKNWMGLYHRDWLPFIVYFLATVGDERRKYRQMRAKG